MPISAVRVAANRSNAQHSTGSKTGVGKAQDEAAVLSELKIKAQDEAAVLSEPKIKPLRNRFAHGLSATRFIVTPWENASAFDQLVADLHAEHQPRTPTETILVNRMAEHHWLRGRALVMQELCFHTDRPECFEPAELALFLRYQTTHERAFARCLAELQKLKKAARPPEKQEETSGLGFESQKRPELEIDTASPSASVPEKLLQAHPQPREHRDGELPPAPEFVVVPHQRLPAALVPTPEAPDSCLLSSDFVLPSESPAADPGSSDSPS